MFFGVVLCSFKSELYNDMALLKECGNPGSLGTINISLLRSDLQLCAVITNVDVFVCGHDN
jgi:hypothetical protein